jgi:hypothetical protein
MPLDAYRQVIAHEVAHCWQSVHLLDASRPGYQVTAWREEGLAEQLSNLVYPSVDSEWWFLPELGLTERSTTIFDRTYTNWVFFQYLGNRLGDPGLIGTLQDFPSSGGLAEQAAALAAVPDMQELYHRFARDYTTQSIVDESGEEITTIATSTFVQVDEATDQLFVEDAFKPFGVARYDVDVLTDPDWHLAEFNTLATGADGRQGYLTNGLWDRDGPNTPPSPLPRACKGYANFIIVMTYISGDRTVEMEVPEYEEVNCEPIPDACSLLSSGALRAMFTYGVMDPERQILAPNRGSGCSWHGASPDPSLSPVNAYYTVFDHFNLALYADIGRAYDPGKDVTYIDIEGASRAWTEPILYGLSVGMTVGYTLVTFDIAIHTGVVGTLEPPEQVDMKEIRAWMMGLALDLATSVGSG